MTRFGRRPAMGAVAALVILSGCGLLGGPGGPSPEELRAVAAEDGRIRAELEARLSAEPSIGPGRIRVAVERGEVELHGTVAGFGALRCAEANAELTRGVQLVIDFLVLEPGPSQVRCLARRG